MARDGSLSLAEAAAGITGVGAGVTDLGADGRLTAASTAADVPKLMAGLAAN